MVQIPTAEEFFQLSMLVENYTKNVREALRCIEIPKDAAALRESDFNRLAAITAKARSNTFHELLEASTAWQWLAEQSALDQAMQSLTRGYAPVMPTDRLRKDRMLKALKHCATLRGNFAHHVDFRVTRPSQYIYFLAGIATASDNFLTGRSVRAATEGRSISMKMQGLLLEFQRLGGSGWLAPAEEETLSTRTEKLLTYLQRITPQPAVSRRNDGDLGSRLFAIELIRLNQRIYSATHKRAVFHLMGLPLFERPLEMRTIERLAKAERERKKEEHDTKGGNV
ncbi:hypothetical protein FA278_16595 [Pseudomonas aeruginosa]|uniref:hypothetical protein n=1 Tax=Pseudomonas aeruginosa TaxID=287 RepID=UPI000F53D061|nr:hypothetical protein [Pseudomonas aeruginosa]MBA5007931.1 hypothetical protein [Pseudomonas aeruginosa]MBG4422243.1 hypothetical protein [Pseudomonas aeruginosa]MCO2745536.1 hypothetical protein [Pseudomonas aeruginosa]MCO2844615.1 hypothetical protein [Pseudomonas aeruginosa]MCO2862329.1 hypothetical protein [Pseudomonas aeruginosa]